MEAPQITHEDSKQGSPTVCQPSWLNQTLQRELDMPDRSLRKNVLSAADGPSCQPSFCSSSRGGPSPSRISLILALAWLSLGGLSTLADEEPVSEEEIKALLSHRDLNFGGERHPYEMKIWAGPGTPESCQHLLFLAERLEGGKPAYRIACDDLYEPSPKGDDPVMRSRDCYLDRAADGSVEGELHQTGKQAGDLEDTAFFRFIAGKEPEDSMKFAPASENAKEGYQSILRRMLAL